MFSENTIYLLMVLISGLAFALVLFKNSILRVVQLIQLLLVYPSCSLVNFNLVYITCYSHNRFFIIKIIFTLLGVDLYF